MKWPSRKTLHFRLAVKAEKDLNYIWSYLSEENSESTATRIVSRIVARFQQIAQFPFSGAMRPYLGTDIRVIFYKKYAIYYVLRETEVIVTRVLHGARDIASIAEDGGFGI